MKNSTFQSTIQTGLSVLLGLTAWCTSIAAPGEIASNARVRPFRAEQVRLLAGPFKQAQDKDAAYLLTVDPDRLLAGFQTNAGLPPKAEKYGGWETQTIAGHSLGHYLSAVSLMFASTGDPRFQERADYIVHELATCQASGGDGLISAIPNIRTVFEEVARGDIRTQGFDLNGIWVPWYTQHKILAGLLDAHCYVGNEEALDVAVGFADWGIEATKNLNKEQFQKMLICEFGGVNESYYELYARTGEDKYLDMGDRFYHHSILDPLREGRDELSGKHGNTQIPKIIGLARRAEIAEDNISAEQTATFFQDRVAHHHSYVTGGHSMGEYFGEPDHLNDRLRDDTTETCNTYNMLKLTKMLFQDSGDPEYLDFYECALFNHILPSMDRSDDPERLFTYFVPLRSGGFRTYSDPFNSWTCCHGTGMENHARYNESIFYVEKDESGNDVLFIALMIPAVLDWKEKGIRVSVLGDRELRIEADADVTLPIRVRVPGNTLCVSNESIFTAGTEWNSGKTSIALPFTPVCAEETMPDNPDRIACFFGPWLYAGNLGSPELPIASPHEPSSLEKITLPVIISTERNFDKLFTLPECYPFLKLDGGDSPILKATNGNPVEMVPFYDATGRYIVYFDWFTPDTWAAAESEYNAEQERIARENSLTVDFFQPGEMQPERDHDFRSERSNHGIHQGRKWRDAHDGGFFEFEMKIDPLVPCRLVLTYWGGDGGNREFDVLIDEEKIATQTLKRNSPDRFFEVVHELANPNGKETIRVRFQAHPGMIAGGFFGAKTVRANEP